MHVLDFDIGTAALGIAEENVDARVASVFLLACTMLIGMQVGNEPQPDGFFRKGRPVLMPTMVPSASTISSMWRYFRVGLSCSDIQMREPGVVSPRIDPVLGQDPVMAVPSGNRASKRKRL